MNLVDIITKKQIRTDLPEIQPGYTVKVDIKISETDAKGVEKNRIQSYEGVVVAVKGRGIGRNFIVRKTSGGVGVERTFPFNSPIIVGITVVKKGKARRAKLYYLRKTKKDIKFKEMR